MTLCHVVVVTTIHTQTSPQLLAAPPLQAAEVCVVYRLNITNEWYRWHGAAVQRLGKAFPLEPLARVREAYRTQQVPTEQQLQVRGDAYKSTCCATAAEQC